MKQDQAIYCAIRMQRRQGSRIQLQTAIETLGHISGCLHDCGLCQGNSGGTS